MVTHARLEPVGEIRLPGQRDGRQASELLERSVGDLVGNEGVGVAAALLATPWAPRPSSRRICRSADPQRICSLLLPALSHICV